jgi:YesN/AraC family two-component response regulator
MNKPDGLRSGSGDWSQGGQVADSCFNAAFEYYRRLSSVQEYVRKRDLTSITLKDVAKAIGVSPSRLSHLFRERVGISFSEWLARQRVERAKTLIRLNDLSTAEVAYAAGFGSYRSFERSFKKVTGLTPLQFRKEIRTQISAGIRQYLSHL